MRFKQTIQQTKNPIIYWLRIEVNGRVSMQKNRVQSPTVTNFQTNVSKGIILSVMLFNMYHVYSLCLIGEPHRSLSGLLN